MNDDWITRDKVNELVEMFIQSKDKKFQGKTIISLDTCKDIIKVLNQPIKNGFGTANFRFWARKRFILKELNFMKVVHDKKDQKPICLKEEIFDVVLKAHKDCKHKGVDFTYKQIQKFKSYLPKSLVKLIIKECTYCESRKESKKVDFHDILDLYLYRDV